MSSLVIRRVRKFWQDRARDYLVLVDGEEAARIGNGGTIEVEVDPGEHSVRVGIDWCRSPELRVTVPAGEAIHMECGPNPNPLPGPAYAGSWRDASKDDYIWLHPVRAATPGVPSTRSRGAA